MTSAGEKLAALLEVYRVYEESKQELAGKGGNSQSNEDLINNQHLFIEAYKNYANTALQKALPLYESDLLAEALDFCKHQTSKEDSSKSDSSIFPGFSFRRSPLFKPVEPNNTAIQDLDAEKEVRALTIEERSAKYEPLPNKAQYITAVSPFKKAPKGRITIVESEGVKYTRIGPPSADSQRAFAPSPNSAFRPALALDGKRLRLDPGLQHLQDPNRNRLTRSTSVPVSYADGVENTPPRHRILYRTGSFVSDLTKQKLKNSILARTSAALVKKPSITDQEMMEIRNSEGSDDSDSSASDNEFENGSDDGSNARKRKYSDEIIAITSSRLPHLLPVVITTSGPT